MMKNLFFGIFSLAISVVCLPLVAAQPTAGEVFEQGLRPILDSPVSSSCRQCHLAGVELKNYIAPTHETTFRSLRDQGLIDVDQPEKSKILALINMQDKGAKANRRHDQRRAAEYKAFRDWIIASSKDRQLRNLPPLDKQALARPEAPDAVIRHGRKDRLLDSFENNVWAFRFRCMSCHIEGSPENEKHRKEHGDQVAWIKREGPAATMRYLLSVGVIDLDQPEQSLLLLKPLGDVEHAGGKKFAPGDLGYQAFRRWIEDYAKTVNGHYKSASDLPRRDDRERFGTEIWVKLADTPSEWGDKLLRVELYAWNAAAARWESELIASTDRIVWGKGKMWQHNLTLYARRGSPRAAAWKASAPALPAGKYLLKVYVLAEPPTTEQWQTSPNDRHYVGQVVFESKWPAGYGKMTSVDSRRVRKEPY